MTSGSTRVCFSLGKLTRCRNFYMVILAMNITDR